MRFLFTTQPGTGHLHPLIPVAAGLRAAGHDVAFAASGGLAAELAAAGFPHHAVGRPWHTSRILEAFPELAAIAPGPKRYAWARRHVFTAATTLDVVPDLLGVAARWRPDVIVREAAEYAGYIAAEVLGLPHAVVRTDSGSSSYAERHVVAPALDDLRSRYGLTADPSGEGPFGHLQLSFAPPGLDEDPAPPGCVQLRPIRAGEAVAPPWFDAVARRGPVVYATLGTVYNSPALLATIVDALADEPLELVVTTSGSAVERALPANVHVEPWIPQDAVLPRCAAVVTHGGFGTVSAALAHGLPMVLLPISADQPMNAARLVVAGVGVAVAPDDRTPAAIRRATRRVLDEPAFARTARRSAAAARRRPDLAHAIALLERLGASGATSREDDASLAAR